MKQIDSAITLGRNGVEILQGYAEELERILADGRLRPTGEEIIEFRAINDEINFALAKADGKIALLQEFASYRSEKDKKQKVEVS